MKKLPTLSTEQIVSDPTAIIDKLRAYSRASNVTEEATAHFPSVKILSLPSIVLKYGNSPEAVGSEYANELKKLLAKYLDYVEVEYSVSDIEGSSSKNIGIIITYTDNSGIVSSTYSVNSEKSSFVKIITANNTGKMIL